MLLDFDRYEIYLILLIVMFIFCIANRVKFMVKGKLLKAKVQNYVIDPRRKEEVPLMEFMYCGELISVPALSYRQMKYSPGEELDIYYIPGNKNYVKIKKDYSDLILGLVALAMIIFIMVYWIFPII